MLGPDHDPEGTGADRPLLVMKGSGGVGASMATLQALDVARKNLAIEPADAEASIRRIARRLQAIGSDPGLRAFAALGMELEAAPREVLGEQAKEALAALEPLLAVPPAGWSSPPSVMLLARDAPARASLEAALEGPHRRLVQVVTAEDARIACRTDRIDVAVLDLGAAPDAVRALVSEIRQRTIHTCAIVLLDPDSPSLQAECFALGADLCLPAPVDPGLLGTIVAGQLDRRSRARDVAVQDHLTGLVNRAAFKEAHRRVRAEANRHAEPLSLAMVDLDYFKDVNDRFGHATGDRVLIGVATQLESRFREGDLVSRWGGDEFAVLLPRTGPDGAVRAISEVLDQMADRPFRGSDGVTLPPITFSAGVSDGRDRFESAMEVADRRLYRAKERGRGRIEGPGTD